MNSEDNNEDTTHLKATLPNSFIIVNTMTFGIIIIVDLDLVVFTVFDLTEVTVNIILTIGRIS